MRAWIVSREIDRELRGSENVSKFYNYSDKKTGTTMLHEAFLSRHVGITNTGRMSYEEFEKRRDDLAIMQNWVRKSMRD